MYQIHQPALRRRRGHGGCVLDQAVKGRSGLDASAIACAYRRVESGSKVFVLQSRRRRFGASTASCPNRAGSTRSKDRSTPVIRGPQAPTNQQLPGSPTGIPVPTNG